MTSVNIAKRLKISRFAIWIFRKRNPLVDAWSDAILAERASAHWGGVKYRMTMIAQQGSVAHADQFCKMEANVYARRALPFDRDFGSNGQVPTNAGVTTIVNLLCPRPEQYAGAFNQVVTAPAPPALPPAANIPVLHAKVPQ